MVRLLSVRLISLAAPLLFTACSDTGSTGDGPTTIVFMTDNIGRQQAISKSLAREFEEATGIHVEFAVGPESATERLSEYQKFFAAGSDRYDIYQVDVTWPGLLADHLEDLSDSVTKSEHFPAMLENNTVDGRLVAVPFYADAGLLYYRTDLLKKYGYSEPPTNLDELGEIASTIMRGERSEGKDGFQGFVFQGASYEGLTCNALEWQVGAGGGLPLSEQGEPNLNNEATRDTFRKVAGWIGDISPQGVLSYKEEESRTVFQSGNAAFLRNWPYVYTLANEAGSLIEGKIGIVPVPGEKRAAATLGGWGLAVSRYSNHKEEAKRFVEFLSSKAAQKQRAIEGGYFASRPVIYDDPEVNNAVPHYARMKDVFQNAVPRPSSVAGRSYNEISAAYYQAVHQILAGEETPEEALPAAEKRMKSILSR